MVSGNPEPGWYEDYENPALLRYWDGAVWTADTQPPSTPAQAVAPPHWTPIQPIAVQPAAFQPIASRPAAMPRPSRVVTPPGYPANAYTRPAARSRRPVSIIVRVVVVLMGFFGTRAALTHAFDTLPAGQAGTPHRPYASSCTDQTPLSATLTKTLTSTRPAGSPVINRTGAAAILKQVWAARNTALAACDLATLTALETGSARLGDLGQARCGCLQLAGSGFSASRLFVPRQEQYPAYFVAMARTVTTEGNSWTEVMAFSRSSPTTRWQLSLATGWGPSGGKVAELGYPVLDADGYAAVPDTHTSAAAQVAVRRLASYYQAAKNTGRLPANPFTPGFWSDQMAADIAAHRQDAVQRNGLHGHFSYTVDPADPVFQVISGSQGMACGVVRFRSVYTGRNGGHPYQTADLRNWGPELAEGGYKSITVSGVSQTCFFVPVRGGPALVLGGDYINETVSTGVPLD
jgi:hypothetical protein